MGKTSQLNDTVLQPLALKWTVPPAWEQQQQQVSSAFLATKKKKYREWENDHGDRSMKNSKVYNEWRTERVLVV